MQRHLMIPVSVMNDGRLSDQERVVYGAVRGIEDNVPAEWFDKMELWPGLEMLQEWTGYAAPEIWIALRRLHELGLLIQCGDVEHEVIRLWASDPPDAHVEPGICIVDGETEARHAH